MIKPEIGKLPKSVVDQIPLVMYIPPPPVSSEPTSSQSGVTIPKAVYSYPPKSSPPSLPQQKRFKFLKSKKEKAAIKSWADQNEKAVESTKPTDPQSWEDHWEQAGYPFVVLEGNRAACAICLMDFEEPKRIIEPNPDTNGTSNETPVVEASSAPPAIQTINVEPPNAVENDPLKLTDAGDGAQPLRLLACGHVFHVRSKFFGFVKLLKHI